MCDGLCERGVRRADECKKHCSVCDARNPKTNHGARWLTDLHNSNNMTCWVSQKLQRNDENVSLELALGKKYEVTYVSVQFCSSRPDSVAIYKSADFGRSWVPFQFYSSQCRKLFNRSPRSMARGLNEQEALCTQFANGPHEDAGAAGRIAFSTLEGRPSAYAVEESPILQDWMTVTNLRITMLRLRPPVDSDSLEQQSSEPEDTSVYAVADVSVGGRCKCNGHASKCKHNQASKLVCDCRHNTMGDDCEKCKPLFQDRPWSRASPKSANECQKCNCHMHSKQCRFNKDVYLQTGKESGGVCLKCKHNTAGRQCHFCAEGFYRDWTKPFTHRKVCRPCECHPVGAIDSLCNQTTGQCRCKEGVTGTACDRCQTGYQQSRSPATPCVRIRTVAPTTELDRTNREQPRQCDSCTNTQKVNLAKYCESDYAVQAFVDAEEAHGEWIKLTITVQNIFKKTTSSIRRGEQDFWIHRNDLACGCPRVRVQKQYVIVTEEITEDRLNGLVLNRSSVMVPWREEWLVRLRNFQRDERSGKCDDVQRDSRMLF